MIIYEHIKDTDLILAYSSNNMKIRQDETGDLYDEAIDPESYNRTYTETDEPIENILTPAQALEFIFGDGEIPEEEEDNDTI